MSATGWAKSGRYPQNTGGTPKKFDTFGRIALQCNDCMEHNACMRTHASQCTTNGKACGRGFDAVRLRRRNAPWRIRPTADRGCTAALAYSPFALVYEPKQPVQRTSPVEISWYELSLPVCGTCTHRCATQGFSQVTRSKRSCIWLWALDAPLNCLHT